MTTIVVTDTYLAVDRAWTQWGNPSIIYHGNKYRYNADKSMAFAISGAAPADIDKVISVLEKLASHLSTLPTRPDRLLRNDIPIPAEELDAIDRHTAVITKNCQFMVKGSGAVHPIARGGNAAFGTGGAFASGFLALGQAPDVFMPKINNFDRQTSREFDVIRVDSLNDFTLRGLA